MAEIERRINLKDELDEVKEILYTHVNLFNTHLENFKQHEERVLNAHQELLSKIKASSDDTKDLVLAWQAATGTIKTLSVIGAIIKWLTGFAIGIGMLWAVIHGQLPTGK